MADSEKRKALMRWQGAKYKNNVGEILVDEVRKTYPDGLPSSPALDLLIKHIDEQFKALAGWLQVKVEPDSPETAVREASCKFLEALTRYGVVLTLVEPEFEAWKRVIAGKGKP